MRKSLLWQIAIPFIVLILVAVGGLTIYFSNYVETIYLSNLHQNLRVEADLLAEQIAVPLQQNEDQSLIEARVQDFSALTGARTTIILVDGTVAGESSTDPTGMENHLDRPEVQTALQSQSEGVDIRFSDTLKERFYYLAIPVKAGDELLGFVRLSSSLAKITADVKSLQRVIFTSGILVIVLFVLVSFFVAERTIHPLQKLAEEVTWLQGGQQIELASDRKDEIGMLTQAFAHLANQLAAQIDEFREERGKLEAVLNHMTDGVLIVDADGTVTLINPAAQRIFTTEKFESVIGKSLMEVVRQYQVIDLWRSAKTSNAQQIATLEMLPQRQFVQGIATPLESSLPGSTLLVFQDLTRVRKLETVRRDFVSNVSHELRTPLASLKALTETLEEGALEDPPAARRFLNRMNNEIDNMTQLVRELLELSKIESGKVPLNLRPVEPVRLLVSAGERMALQAERAGINLQVVSDENLPAVNADGERIEQVLVNLIHNAVKFTRPGGEIKVLAHLDDQFVVFQVQDTGVGIESDAIPRIFERFYKADQSRSGGGTGLGLSIARHIIEAHGGRIWVESKVNQGSTFSFCLPVYSSAITG